MMRSCAGHGPLNGVSAHVADHLRIDPFGRMAQGQFAQSRQIALREEVMGGTPRLFGHINFALRHARDQVLWRQIDQFDLIGGGQHAVGARTLTLVMRSTMSFRLSICWILSVE